MRVVIAEDMALLRQGLARLLTDAGFDVLGGAGDADELLELVARTEPDAALIDIKMPPTHTDEGLRAATVIRERYPKTAVLLLSSYLEARYAEALLSDHPAGSGYLLKDRVYDAAVVGDALRRVSTGECVIDPEIISQLLRRGRERNPLDTLTERERQILSLMAQGYSNDSICNQLVIPQDRGIPRQQRVRQTGHRRVAREQPPRARRARLPAELNGREGSHHVPGLSSRGEAFANHVSGLRDIPRLAPPPSAF